MTAVEVVIPHRSRWDLLERCLASLERQTLPVAVCVVDNDSRDDSLARLAARPAIRVQALPRNVGFGRAVNLGVRGSRADVVVVLNNDMVLEPDCIERMTATLAAHPRCTTAARQLRLDGRIDSIGVGVDVALCAYDVGHGEARDASAGGPLVPIGPSGGAAAFPRALFEELGGYDEEIFAYLEDVDLALRLRLAGVAYRPTAEAIAWHAHSATLGTGSSRKNELMGWSRGYLLWKYGPSLGRAAKVRGAITDAVVYTGQALIDRNLGAVRGRVASWRGRRGRPAGDRITAVLPHSDISTADGLRRRLLRR